MIQRSLAIVLIFICSLAMAFVPSSFGIYKQQTHLCAEAHDPFDMDDGDESIPEDPYHKLFHWSDSCSRPPTSAFIILFRPGTKEEGVHTIEYPRNSGNNVILAFEAKQDCDKFAGALKEQNFFEPLPQEMNLENLKQYCHSIGVHVQVVPSGMELVPPSERVKELWHEPNLRDHKNTLENLVGRNQVQAPGVVLDESGSSWE